MGSGSSIPTVECDHCHRKADKMPVCKGCDTVTYCDIECQRKEWVTHKRYCKKKGEQGRMLALLPEDLIHEIFQTLGVKSMVFFRICKKFNNLREPVLLRHCNAQTRYSPFLIRSGNERMDLRVLLDFYRWPCIERGGHYTKFIKILLKFIANKKRKETFYVCRNSYHRRLVHLFCDKHGLDHKTIDTGRSKDPRNVCGVCGRRRYSFDECNSRQKRYLLDPCQCTKHIVKNIGILITKK